MQQAAATATTVSAAATATATASSDIDIFIRSWPSRSSPRYAHRYSDTRVAPQSQLQLQLQLQPLVASTYECALPRRTQSLAALAALAALLLALGCDAQASLVPLVAAAHAACSLCPRYAKQGGRCSAALPLCSSAATCVLHEF